MCLRPGHAPASRRCDLAIAAFEAGTGSGGVAADAHEARAATCGRLGRRPRRFVYSVVIEPPPGVAASLGMRGAHLGRDRAVSEAQQHRAQDSNLDLTVQSRPSCRWTSPVRVNRRAIWWPFGDAETVSPQALDWSCRSVRSAHQDGLVRRWARPGNVELEGRPTGEPAGVVEVVGLVGRPGVAPGRVRRRRLYRPPRLSSGLPPRAVGSDRSEAEVGYESIASACFERSVGWFGWSVGWFDRASGAHRAGHRSVVATGPRGGQKPK